MAQETDRASWQVSPWAGTLETLTRAGDLAARRVADAASFPEGYDPEDTSQAYDRDKDDAWRRAERAREVEITVLEDQGFTRELTAIEDLDGLVDDRLDTIGVVDMEIGGKGYSAPSVEIAVSRRNGLEVRVAGRDRQWTAGLRHELQEVLHPRERLRPRGLPSSEEAIFPVVTAAFSLTLVAMAVIVREVTSWATGVRLAVDLAGAVLVGGFVLLVGLRLPRFELLAPGARPTYQRWKVRIVGGAVALVVGIAATIIGGAITG
jgi:hypothetical protein